MSRSRMALVLASAFLAAAAASAAEYKPGEVIVKFKDGVMRTRATTNLLYDALGVKKVRRFTGMMTGYEQLILDPSVKVQDAVAALEKSSVVEYAQPNYILHAMPIRMASRIAHPADGGGTPCIPGMDVPGCDPNSCASPGFPAGCASTPSSDPGSPTAPAARPDLRDAPPEINPPVADPDLAKVYGMAKISAIDAWKIYRGNKDFIVADIDTGVDYNHEDLAFNMWRNPNPSDKKDIVGYDFVHNDGLPFDDNEHGTHTAGTIAAVGGNGVGISGVIQVVSLMSVKFLSGEGAGTSADAVRAIDYAVEHGAKVLSNSWGGKGDSDNKILEDSIVRAQQHDVLFIAAAGNDGGDNDGNDPDYPAAFKDDNIISVAATDDTDTLAFFSNYGKTTTHLAAPGTNIYSTVPGNKYTMLDGTSMACPHVAGAAALLWSQHPSWHYQQVKQVLLDNVDKVASLGGKMVSGGRLNILKALQAGLSMDDNSNQARR